MAKSKGLPKIIGHIQEYLKKKFQDNSILLKKIDEDSAIFGVIAGKGVMFISDEESGHNISIVPIPILQRSNDYWCSLLLSLSGSVAEVDHVSIAIFTGNRSDLKKTKLFRAEWGNNSHHKHAQPHWHLHTDDSAIKNQFWDEEQQAANFYSEALEAGTDKVKRIHFAMAARWHEKEKKESHLVSLKGVDDNGVLLWVSNTFEYILHQLTYLEDKSELKE
jgi:hypothetical protein